MDLKEEVIIANNVVQQLKEKLDKYRYGDRSHKCSSGPVYNYKVNTTR